MKRQKASIRSLEARKEESTKQCEVLKAEIGQVDSELQVARGEFDTLGQQFNAISTPTTSVDGGKKQPYKLVKNAKITKRITKLRTKSNVLRSYRTINSMGKNNMKAI